MDDQLYEALGRLAAREQRSISQQVIVILKEHLPRSMRHTNATEDFLAFFTTWKDDRVKGSHGLRGQVLQSSRSHAPLQGMTPAPWKNFPRDLAVVLYNEGRGGQKRMENKSVLFFGPLFCAFLWDWEIRRLRSSKHN